MNIPYGYRSQSTHLYKYRNVSLFRLNSFGSMTYVNHFLYLRSISCQNVRSPILFRTISFEKKSASEINGCGGVTGSTDHGLFMTIFLIIKLYGKTMSEPKFLCRYATGEKF